MTYKEIIENITPYDYSKYKDVSSNEKLGAFTACYLVNKSVPLTFNYLCISMFKMFPDKFCCDEDFKEYPSVDRLNRTLMHMSISKTSPILNGTAKNGYQLTNYGKSIGLQVKAIIDNTEIDKNIIAPMVDKYKSAPLADYNKFLESPGFNKFQSTEIATLDDIWPYFRVIPFTQMSTIKKKLLLIRNKAKEEKNAKCVEYIDRLSKLLGK